MSETPRTDEVNKYLRIREEYAKTDNEIWVNHARTLERELNAANQIGRKYEDRYFAALDRIKRLEEENNELRAEEARLLNTNGELERRIKRLEEAGSEAICHLEYASRVRIWNEAKEDKL